MDKNTPQYWWDDSNLILTSPLLIPFTQVGQLCPCCGNMINESQTKMPSVQKPLYEICFNNYANMNYHILCRPNPIASHGYVPVKKGDTRFPIGHLTASSYSIIRIIIHSCLLWGECNEKVFSLLISDNYHYSHKKFSRM